MVNPIDLNYNRYCHFFYPTLNPKNIHVGSNYQLTLSGIGIYTLISDDRAFLKEDERRTKEITSLFTAVQHGNIEIIKLLLENGNLEINFVNRYREYYYPDQMYGYFDEIKNISYAETALYAAVDKEMIDIVKLLLSFNKININYINKEGNQAITSLHKAVQKNYLEIVEILLANKNIDINIKDDKRKTPIYYANNEQIKKLFDH